MNSRGSVSQFTSGVVRSFSVSRRRALIVADRSVFVRSAERRFRDTIMTCLIGVPKKRADAIRGNGAVYEVSLIFVKKIA